MMSTYYDELTKAMTALAKRRDTIFMGQAVEYLGTGMTKSLEGVPADQKLELPVFEDTQLGLAIGMSVGGFLPICIYPRWSFLLLAANQLVHHLDKLAYYSRGDYRPKVIVRVAVPDAHPLDPGPQHLGDFTKAFGELLRFTPIIRLMNAGMIVREYGKAVQSSRSTILVEHVCEYGRTK